MQLAREILRHLDGPSKEMATDLCLAASGLSRARLDALSGLLTIERLARRRQGDAELDAALLEIQASLTAVLEDTTYREADRYATTATHVRTFIEEADLLAADAQMRLQDAA